MKIQVKDFMATPVTVVEGRISVGEIRSLMKNKGIHAVPLVYRVDDEIVIRGIVTTTDLCCNIDDAMPVDEAMRFSKVHVIHPTMSAKSASDMMMKNKVHHIVVMDDGKIVGMISSLDFVKLVSEHELDQQANKIH